MPSATKPGAKGASQASQASSSTAGPSAATTSSNRAARRQQARKQGRARQYVEEGVKEEEQVKEEVKSKASAKKEDIQDPETQTVEYWGFLPDDYPLSSTDDEAEDTVKEREQRVLRSRKRQLYLHLNNAFTDEARPDWSEVFAQARMLEIKWLDDDLAHAREQASRKGTTWYKELPGKNKWLPSAYKTCEEIGHKYAAVVTRSTDETGGIESCGDQFKTMVMATAWRKEYMRLLPEAMQAMLDDKDNDKEEGGKKGKAKKEDEVLGFELIEGPEGAPCLGVRLRKKNVQQHEMAELLAARVSSLFYDGPPQQSRRK